MFKYLIRIGSKSIKWISRRGSSGIKFISKAFGRGVKGKTGTVLRSIWRVVDVGITGWAIYDIFWGDGDDAQSEAAHSFLYDQLLSDEVCSVLSVPVNDTSVVASAFASCGVRLMDDQIDAYTLKGLSYIAVGVYIQEVPFGSLKFRPDEIKEILKNEAVNFLSSNSDLEDDVKTELETAFSEMEFDEMEHEVLRRFDFLASMISDLADTMDDSSSTSTNQGNSQGTLAPAGNFTIAPIIN